MAGLHSIRKRVSHAKQTRKSVTTGMSSSYTAEKSTVDANVTKLRKALKELEKDRDALHMALKAERSICEILASSVEDGDSGALFKGGVAKLDQARDNIGQVHDKSFKEDVEAVRKHISELMGVHKAMHEVERLLSEKGRYEKKVEKLMDRGKKESGEKRSAKVERNIEKLKLARESFEHAEKDVVERAKEVNEGCVKAAEHLAKAFWGRRNGVLKELEEGSKELRLWAVGEETKADA